MKRLSRSSAWMRRRFHSTQSLFISERPRLTARFSKIDASAILNTPIIGQVIASAQPAVELESSKTSSIMICQPIGPNQSDHGYW